MSNNTLKNKRSKGILRKVSQTFGRMPTPSGPVPAVLARSPQTYTQQEMATMPEWKRNLALSPYLMRVYVVYEKTFHCDVYGRRTNVPKTHFLLTPDGEFDVKGIVCLEYTYQPRGKVDPHSILPAPPMHTAKQKVQGRTANMATALLLGLIGTGFVGAFEATLFSLHLSRPEDYVRRGIELLKKANILDPNLRIEEALANGSSFHEGMRRMFNRDWEMSYAGLPIWDRLAKGTLPACDCDGRDVVPNYLTAFDGVATKM